MTPLLSLANGSTVACIVYWVLGFHFNLNSGEIPRGGVLGKTVQVTSVGVTFTCVRRGPLSHTGVVQKLYEFIFRILFLSETDSGLFS